MWPGIDWLDYSGLLFPSSALTLPRYNIYQRLKPRRGWNSAGGPLYHFYVTQHLPPTSDLYPLETCRDSSVDEPQPSNHCGTLVTSLGNPATSQSHLPLGDYLCKWVPITLYSNYDSCLTNLGKIINCLKQ